MPAYVLDTSLTLAITMPDELTDGYSDLGRLIIRHGAIVPTLWRLEVANAYLNAVRRKRITYAVRQEIIADVEAMNIEIDPLASTIAFTTLSDLADKHRLTIYDAAYLELAMRTGYPLASLDRDLRAAATAEGVTVLPVEG